MKHFCKKIIIFASSKTETMRHIWKMYDIFFVDDFVLFAFVFNHFCIKIN